MAEADHARAMQQANDRADKSAARALASANKAAARTLAKAKAKDTAIKEDPAPAAPATQPVNKDKGAKPDMLPLIGASSNFAQGRNPGWVPPTFIPRSPNANTFASPLRRTSQHQKDVTLRYEPSKLTIPFCGRPCHAQAAPPGKRSISSNLGG